MARDGGRIGIPELLVGVPFPVVPLEIMRFARRRPVHSVARISRPHAHRRGALHHGLVETITDRIGCWTGAAPRPAVSGGASPRRSR